MHIAFAIHPDTNDLFLDEAGNVATVIGAEAVGQHAKQRLQTFYGEWFLDNTAGVQWLSELFAKEFNPELAEAVVKNEILDTDGVTSIESFSVSFNNHTRNLQIRDVAINTVYEEVVSI